MKLTADDNLHTSAAAPKPCPNCQRAGELFQTVAKPGGVIEYWRCSCGRIWQLAIAERQTPPLAS